MPEGDTTWRTARALHAALAGKTVVAFASSLDLTGVVQRGPRLRDGGRERRCRRHPWVAQRMNKGGLAAVCGGRTA